MSPVISPVVVVGHGRIGARSPPIVLFDCRFSAALSPKAGARYRGGNFEDIYPSILYVKASSLLATVS